MRNYSPEIKKTALEKVLRPGADLKEISLEMNIPKDTLYFWQRQVQNGSMSQRNKSRKSLQEKMNIVLEAGKLKDKELGLWLREKGLTESQITAWEKEITGALEHVDGKDKREAEHKGKIKDLERELRSKDKALAEMSALIVFKKKLDSLFGEENTPN